MNEESIFAAAIEKTERERGAYLDRVCADDADLRSRVEALLAAHDNPDSYLDNPVSEAEPTIDHSPSTERPGATIGPYTLREQLGTGGMGVVWAAEQKQPLRRKVAIKVIKPGMDTEQVIARFENEREALALMDHPNIAKVLDAGTTDGGRPYFVMEVICGVPITEYCDAMRLTVAERLDLFVQVCSAVQHAHQKGIIHRDIKPNNVLVSEQDGRPVPKIIDFGIAKALHRSLTDHSIYTGVFQAIGTLAYMSPEQAGLSVSDIDTRSDIYALGVLLYELLTGVTPFEKDELASAALDEACRIIREQDPPKPSTRISALGERAGDVSDGRRTDPNSLGKLVSGDLDWIIMKALDKDRKRRYETARDLAADVRRHLRDDVVEARPPSFGYRFGKAVHRNRTLFAAGTLVACALLIGVIVSTFLAIKWAGEVREHQNTIHDRTQALKRVGEVALRWATQNTMFGDREGADEAMTVSKKAKINPNRVEFVEAVLYLYGKDGKQAEACQKARRLLAGNDTVANRALFANGILWSGKGTLEDHYEQLLSLQSQAAEPGISAVLMAQAIGVVAPARAEMLLRTSRNSPMVAGLLAQTLLDQAVQHEDLQMARQALSHMHAAREFLQDSSMLRGLNVSICLALYQRSEEGDRERYAMEALRVMEEAGNDPAPVELLSHSNFHGLLENEEELIELDQRFLVMQFRLDHALPRLLRRLGHKTALSMLQESPPRHDSPIDSRIGPEMMLRALDRGLHESVLATIVKEDVVSPAVFVVDRRVSLLSAALLAGDRQDPQVLRILRELKKYELSDIRRPKRFCDFIQDDIDVGVFLKTNADLVSRRAISHFFAGIVAMSEDDRSAAMRHFHETAELGPNSSAYYEWAKTLRILLENHDPLLDWVGHDTQQDDTQ